MIRGLDAIRLIITYDYKPNYIRIDEEYYTAYQIKTNLFAGLAGTCEGAL